MKKLVAATCLCMAGAGYCVDEYLPIEKGKVELDGGYSFQKPSGSYNDDGDKDDLPSGVSPFSNMVPLQVKYGIMPGLDVEAAWTGTMNNKDYGDLAGFGQPDVAVKYAVPAVGAGAYVDFILPVATGNLDQPEPAMGIQLGAVYGNRFGDFRATGTASYRINMENEDKYKAGNVLSIYLKPEAMWTEYIGTYLGLRYDMAGEGEVDAGPIKITIPDGNLITVAPGLNAVLLPWLAYEVNVPITVMGKNAVAAWGAWASVYVTLPM